MTSTDVLLDVATAARLFHASDGTGFADLIIDGHRETWPLRSKRFQAWLRQQYYERTWDAPSPAALNAALNVLEAQAQFDGPQRKVSVRLAERDGRIYLDLADEFWRCVEISANGWRIAEDPPVRFRRSAGMQPLPLPLRGGSIEALAPFLNLASENDFVLVVTWLLGALRAGGPYPVLAIAGEQGSAKTVLSKLLRALIDPSVAPVRALPRDERELFIAASNGYIQLERSRWPSTCHCRQPRAGGIGPAGALRTRSHSIGVRSPFELRAAMQSYRWKGDPWCIVWDRERELVVLHIARIDCRYVMARASHPKPLTVSSLSAAINTALDELQRAGDDRRAL